MEGSGNFDSELFTEFVKGKAKFPASDLKDGTRQ